MAKKPDLYKTIWRQEYAKNAAIYKERAQQWNKRNPDKRRESARKTRANNPVLYAATRRRWLERNSARMDFLRKRWSRNNPARIAAKVAQRRAMKLRATPAWANQEKITAFYVEAKRLARETGVPHHVDHIYALQAKNYCGLHWEGNLQVITATENIRKSNRHVDDFPMTGTVLVR